MNVAMDSTSHVLNVEPRIDQEPNSAMNAGII